MVPSLWQSARAEQRIPGLVSNAHVMASMSATMNPRLTPETRQAPAARSGSSRSRAGPSESREDGEDYRPAFEAFRPLTLGVAGKYRQGVVSTPSLSAPYLLVQGRTAE